MNVLSRTLTGGIITAGGIVLTVFALFFSLVSLIYSIPILLIGLFILFNTKEDVVESRKDLKIKKAKK